MNDLLKDVLAFDVETTGLVGKGLKYDTDFALFPHIVQMSWTINGVEKDFIIYPEGYEIPAEAAAIHGITTEIAIEKGVPLAEVMIEFVMDSLKAKIVVGHNIYFDTSVIKANCLRLEEPLLFLDLEAGIHKFKRVDTMMKTIKFVGAKQEGSNRAKFPSLEELYFKLFNEGFPAHNSKEDVRAGLRCLPELVALGLIVLEPKTE